MTAPAGSRIASVTLASLSALKTFDPPFTALEGAHVAGVTRRGKFLDLSTDDGLHLVWHLSRAGWVQWRDEVPATPVKPGKGPLALRIAFVSDDGEPMGGFDVTEAGTRKGLALYVVRDPLAVPGSGETGTRRPLRRAHPRAVHGDPRCCRAVAGQGRPARPVGDRRHRQRVQRRDPPCRPALAFPSVQLAVDRAGGGPLRRHARRADDRDREQRRPRHRHPEVREEGQPGGARQGGRCLPGVRRHVREVSFADSALQYCPTCQTGGKPLADRRTSKFLK